MERIAILGAGVSGLTSAMLLKERGYDITVFESTERVGGLARSFEWHGFHCDIAPHRLFTHDEEAKEDLLRLVPMNLHQRRSRIFISGKNMRDPVNPFELIRRLSPRVSSRLVLGYLFKPKLPEDSFENLALNKFGRGLYELFFEPYTWKMFGVSPAKISVAWGRQKLRVSGLRDLLRRDTKIYFRTFYYPKTGGYGAICDALHKQVEDRVLFNARVIGVDTEGDLIRAVRYEQDGTEHRFNCDRLFSTLPATIFGRMLGHEFSLRFQAVTLVYLLVDKPLVMPYHWIYFGDRDVVINRFAEFKNFSDEEVPADRTVVVAEVTMPSEDPLKDVLSALQRYDLVHPREVLDSHQIHERFGYPVYDRNYEKALVEASEIFGSFKNLHLVGRNAEFRHIEVDENYASATSVVRRLEAQRATVEEKTTAQLAP
jgi:protoporphyrinogen oxidase